MTEKLGSGLVKPRCHTLFALVSKQKNGPRSRYMIRFRHHTYEHHISKTVYSPTIVVASTKLVSKMLPVRYPFVKALKPCAILLANMDTPRSSTSHVELNLWPSSWLYPEDCCVRSLSIHEWPCRPKLNHLRIPSTIHLLYQKGLQFPSRILMFVWQWVLSPASLSTPTMIPIQLFKSTSQRYNATLLGSLATLNFLYL